MLVLIRPLLLTLAVVLVPTAVLLPPSILGQATPASTERPKVFVDCLGGPCDLDHIRREIPFVDYVREPLDATVHVLITSIGTGAGGREYRIDFSGRSALEGQDQTLSVLSSSTDTFDEQRAHLTQTLKLGLLRYVAGSEEAQWIVVNWRPAPDLAGQVETQDDPWDKWVLGVGVLASASGEKSSSNLSLSGDVSANRTSSAWKFNLVVAGSYSESRFDLTDDETLRTVTRSYTARSLLAKSVGTHWALGLRSSIATSTFANQDLVRAAAPALEFSVYPYEESSERRIRLVYDIGVRAVDYSERTIFDRTREVIWEESLTLSMAFVRTWGLLDLSLEGSHFLENFDRNHLTLLANADIRVFRGLSISVFGSASHVADQVNIPARVTDEEILLRLRQLATTFTYSLSLGLSFSFGSIFNNVINPRFSG